MPRIALKCFKTSVLITLLCVLQTTGFAKKRVAVNAAVAPQFAEYREENGNHPISYIFGKGTFFGGSTRANTIKETDFMAIAKVLARDFAQQNFTPAENPDEAEMLLVIHWGGIEKLENPNKTFALQKAFDDLYKQAQALQGVPPEQREEIMARDPIVDPLEIRNNLIIQDAVNAGEIMSTQVVASMLGFQETLERERNKPSASSFEETLLMQLQVERYFVIVMAWDYQAMKKGVEKKLLWTTRISMKALGTSFENAVSLMSGAGANYYGTDTDGLATRVFKRNEYEIKFGELEVIDEDEDSDATAQD